MVMNVSVRLWGATKESSKYFSGIGQSRELSNYNIHLDKALFASSM